MADYPAELISQRYLFDGTPVTRATKRIDWSPTQAEKGGYKHFMLKEIHEQPRALNDTLEGLLSHGGLDARVLVRVGGVVGEAVAYHGQGYPFLQAVQQATGQARDEAHAGLEVVRQVGLAVLLETRRRPAPARPHHAKFPVGSPHKQALRHHPHHRLQV